MNRDLAVRVFPFRLSSTRFHITQRNDTKKMLGFRQLEAMSDDCIWKSEQDRRVHMSSTRLTLTRPGPIESRHLPGPLSVSHSAKQLQEIKVLGKFILVRLYATTQSYKFLVEHIFLNELCQLRSKLVVDT